MNEGSYFSRALAFGVGSALLVVAVALYGVSQAPSGPRPQPRLIEVDCLNVERGPTLRFDNGLLKAENAVVGTYKFVSAVGGKHGPLIKIEGTRLRQVGRAVTVEAGDEGWFWRFLDDDTVEIVFYPQNRTVAHRCTA